MKRIVSFLVCAWMPLAIGAAGDEEEQKALFNLPPEIQVIIARYTLSDDIKKDLFDKFDQPYLKHILHHTATSASFNKKGTRIISVGLDEVRIWDAQNGQLIRTLQHDGNNISSATFNEEGTQIVSADYHGKIRIWDTETGDLIHVLRGHDRVVRSAVFNRDGTKVVSASLDRTVRIWDTQNGHPMHILHGHEGPVKSATFNEAGTQIVSASNDNTVRIWDVETGALVRILRGHENAVKSAEFNTSGTQILSSSNDGTARLWDVKTGNAMILRHKYPYIRSAFNKTGTHIVSSDTHKTILWDAKTGARVKVDKSCTYSPNFNTEGTCIVSAVDFGQATKIWDINTGKITLLPTCYDGFYSASFNTVGTQVVATSDNGIVCIWELAPLPYERYHFNLEQAIWIYNTYHEIISEKKNQSKISRLSEMGIDPLDPPFNFYCFALPQPTPESVIEISQDKRDQIIQKLEIKQSIKEQHPEIIERLESLRFEH